MNDEEMNERLVACECCGEPAKKYWVSYPICNNPVCFQVRLDFIRDKIEELNNNVVAKELE